MGKKTEATLVRKPWLDFTTDAAFLLLSIISIYYCFVEDAGNMILIWLALVVVGIYVVVHISGALGTFLSRRWLSGALFGDPLSSKITHRKFTAQCWQLVVHVGMAYLEYQAVKKINWVDEPHLLGPPAKHLNIPIDRDVINVYVIQSAIWIVTGLSHRFVEEHHKDYYVMYFHHIVTLAVVSGSRSRGLHLYGTVIFWIHDVSDIPLDLMKICNLLRLHGYSCFFITEISYFVTVGVWVFQRLYRLPFWLLYSVIIDSTFGEFNGRRTFCSDAESNGTVLDCYILRFSTALLAILLLMHIFWTYLLLRIARRSLYVGEDAHVVGREEYEGHSSDDEQYANSSRITDKSKKVK
eukprot:c9580_g1_i1.p1 GENE.c9580_g1_i1~~c9580_g1_i1.p1  ORF type:complete len:353 (+),score=72.25 c9580_g1_i1:38-1096(+)